MKNFVPANVAKIIYAIPMAIFGIFHLMGAEDMVGYVPIPGGVFWVYLTGVGLILAAIAIIINKQAVLACNLLAIMLLIFVLGIHLPQVIDGSETAMPSLLKDLGLAAGAWMAGHLSGD